MATYSTTKRFLAGAICPRCEAIDRIQVYAEGDKDYRECVACGFKDEMHFPGIAKEPATRIRPEKSDGEEQAVKIIAFDSQTKKDR